MHQATVTFQENESEAVIHPSVFLFGFFFFLHSHRAKAEAALAYYIHSTGIHIQMIVTFLYICNKKAPIKTL